MDFHKLCELYENVGSQEIISDGSQDFLSKIFQLLKNDEVFVDQMKAVINGFRKNRYQVTPYQENILKTVPKKIDVLWSVINRLTKIVNDPKKQNQSDYSKFVSDLDDANTAKEEGENLLKQTKDEIAQIVQKNERMNEEYIEQMLVIIKHSANRIFEKSLESSNMTDESSPLDPSEWSMVSKNMLKDISIQIDALQTILSDDDSINPLAMFLTSKEELYSAAKQRYDMMKKDKNYRSSVDQLYTNLPMAAFYTEFYENLTKSPKILTGKSLSKKQQIINKLDGVKNEAEFQNFVPELEEYLTNAKIEFNKKLQIQNIVKGPFISRKGSPNAASKIRKIMKSKTIEESFDQYYQSMIMESMLNEMDENDMMLDMMEVASLIEEASKKCTGSTKKAHSTRKGKKWMKCAKQSDGSYKRIHWGQAGVRVTGKSGNTKRKKSFKARHGCSSAKAGTPKSMACKDWA
jgi:hypothetical protein